MSEESRIRHIRRAWERVPGWLPLLVMDIAVVWVATLLAYWVRFGGVVGEAFLDNVIAVAAFASIVFPVLFWLFRLYHQVWRHVGVDVLFKLLLAVAVGLAVLVVANFVLSPAGETRVAPLGVLFGLATIVFIGSATLRAFARMAVYLQSQGSETSRNVIIIGAGDAGVLLLRDIENQPELGMRVTGFLDDDAGKRGRFIRGVRVIGRIERLPDVLSLHHVQEVLIAIPSAAPADRRRILDVCAANDVRTRIIGTLALEQGSVGVSMLRSVRVEDLLGRAPVDIDVGAISNTLAGRVVAVTGAAGSIGSELCRQIVRMKPSRLLLVDIDESRLYETHLELAAEAPETTSMVVCDIREKEKLARVFERERPDIVLHAAAYKHVPLMEDVPDEAVKTNVLGTRNVIAACERAGVGHFVLISTDKAVEPSSVMGLTKALAERQMLAACSRGLRASAVRFGNVLGSRGSVVPIFEKQLAGGGPIRVTHPEVTRYFMTISEAARLVLQAQAISEGGEVFVLEMGEPVRIVDLARKMIALSGVDTDVEFMGLRPAEKLHETLVHSEAEVLLETGSKKVLRVNALPWIADSFEAEISALIDAARTDDRAGIRASFKMTMPAFVGHGENGV